MLDYYTGRLDGYITGMRVIELSYNSGQVNKYGEPQPLCFIPPAEGTLYEFITIARLACEDDDVNIDEYFDLAGTLLIKFCSITGIDNDEKEPILTELKNKLSELCYVKSKIYKLEEE